MSPKREPLHRGCGASIAHVIEEMARTLLNWAGRRILQQSEPPFPLRQQQFEILAAEACEHTVIAGDDGVGKFLFTFLKFEDFFFDGIAGDEPVCKYIARLPDAVAAVDGLCLNCGIPPGIEQEDVFRGGQVQTQAAGLETDQKEAATIVLLKSADTSFTITRLPIEVFVDELFFIQPLLQDTEKTCELRKNQRLMAFFDQLNKLRHQRIQLCTRLGSAFLVDQ